MSEIILSITIPTFNRCNELKKNLAAIYPQIQNRNVELIVSDNASTDGTEEYMKDFTREHPEVRYYRNNNNLGFDGNFMKCFQYASGKYIYILGDDDYLQPGAVESIIEGLRLDPIVLFINRDKIGKKAEKKSIRSEMLPDCNYIIKDKNIALKEVGVNITFISTLIIRNEFIEDYTNLENYFGSYFIFAYGVFQTMNREGIYVINTFDCIHPSANDKVSYDLYYVWFESYRKLLFEGGKLGGINESTIVEVYRTSLKKSLFWFVCHFRNSCDNAYTWNESYLRKNVKQFKDIYWVYFLLLKCPKPFLKVYYQLGRVYFRFLCRK
ncbi:MAG: glycosyltransferase [Lachnospiraceae bacterium]|nr:glycosyltransferase [Lachnospiraceae bacterium]